MSGGSCGIRTQPRAARTHTRICIHARARVCASTHPRTHAHSLVRLQLCAGTHMMRRHTLCADLWGCTRWSTQRSPGSKACTSHDGTHPLTYTHGYVCTCFVFQNSAPQCEMHQSPVLNAQEALWCLAHCSCIAMQLATITICARICVHKSAPSLCAVVSAGKGQTTSSY